MIALPPVPVELLQDTVATVLLLDITTVAGVGAAGTVIGVIEAVPAFEFPAAFLATIVGEYEMFDRPVKETVSVAELTVWQIRPVMQARYSLIEDPPSDSGAVQVRRTVPADGLVASSDGADGTVRAAAVIGSDVPRPPPVIAVTST